MGKITKVKNKTTYTILIKKLPNTYINALASIAILPSRVRKHLPTQYGLHGKAPTDHFFKVLKKCRSKFGVILDPATYLHIPERFIERVI